MLEVNSKYHYLNLHNKVNKKEAYKELKLLIYQKIIVLVNFQHFIKEINLEIKQELNHL